MFHEMPLKMYFMKYSERNVSHRILALRTDNCAIISPGLLTVMNINLNGNTAGSFPIVSKISSSKSSENSPYVLTIFPSSRNAQYLNNDSHSFTIAKKIEVDVFVDG